jgi:alpha-beta hydrolase superfamily lysophospholipase
VRILQSSWQDGSGVKLHMQTWEPDSRPKAVVLLLHGLGEHIVRYADVAEALVRARFVVTGFDLRGHGRSGGRRGHTSSYAVLLDDIDALLARVRSDYPRSPIFLYGHSLGGALAINYVLRRSPTIKGVIATAPWLRAVVQAPAWKVLVARVVEPILPIYTQKWRQGPTDLSRDAAVMTAAQHDPLMHDFITARMYRGATEAGEYALEHAAEFPLPLLLMHGTEDKLTSWQASSEFAQRVGRRCTFRLWEGWYHELHNEQGKATIVRTMVSWMNRRLRPASSSRVSSGQMRRGMRKSRSLRRDRS